MVYYHYHYGLYHRHRRARHTASKQSNPQLAHFSLQDQKKKILSIIDIIDRYLVNSTQNLTDI
jgi:hypothetical protein